MTDPLDAALGIEDADDLDEALGLATKRKDGRRVRTNLLDRTGVSAAEVKRRAAAGEVVDAQRPDYTRGEAMGALALDAVTGLGEGVVGLGGLVADVATTLPRGWTESAKAIGRGEGIGGARDAFQREALALPASRKVTELADRGREAVAQRTGIADVDTGVPGAVVRLVGNILAPGPEIAAAGRKSAAAAHAVEGLIDEAARGADDVLRAADDLVPANENAARLLNPETPAAPPDAEVARLAEQAGRAQARAPEVPPPPRDFVDIELERRRSAPQRPPVVEPLDEFDAWIEAQGNSAIRTPDGQIHLGDDYLTIRERLGMQDARIDPENSGWVIRGRFISAKDLEATKGSLSGAYNNLTAPIRTAPDVAPVSPRPARTPEELRANLIEDGIEPRFADAAAEAARNGRQFEYPSGEFEGQTPYIGDIVPGGGETPAVRRIRDAAGGSGAPPGNVPSLTGPPPTPSDPVQKLLVALKKAKPIRKEQEALYTATRAQRMDEALKARAAARESGLPGRAEFDAELSTLSGKMDRVDFEPLLQDVGQEDVTALFRMAADHPDIRFFESVTARDGLRKLLDGQLPQESQIKLLRRIYGDDMTNELLSKRSALAKMRDAGIQIANIPRAIMSSFDLSAPFRQGVFFVSRPRQFFPAFKKMLASYGSEDAYKAVEDSIRNSPNFDLMHDSGLAITDLEGLATREEAFATSLAEKMPVVQGSGPLRTPARIAAKGYNATVGRGVRASGRAYTAFLTKLRADVFDDLVAKAGVAGLDVEENGGQLAKQIAEFVNAGTGRGNLPGEALNRASKALNAFFFSPRLMASRLALLNPATYLRPPEFAYRALGIPYDKGAAFVRREAQKSALGFVAFGASILALAKAAGADVGTNPYSSDFGKIIVGKTRLDIWGGFQQYARMLAQLAKGKYASATTGKEYTLGEGYKSTTRYDILLRQIESKEAPIFSFVTTMLKQQDWNGQPVSATGEIAERVTPMYLASLYELAKDDPSLLPFGLAAIFGVGLQTFDSKPSKGPIRSSSGSGITSGIGPQSSIDKYGHDAAVQSIRSSAPEGSSPELIAQYASAQPLAYMAPDGTSTTIPASLRNAFVRMAATGADMTNSPVQRWLDAMVKQGKVKRDGTLTTGTALADIGYHSATVENENLVSVPPTRLLPPTFPVARHVTMGSPLDGTVEVDGKEARGSYGEPYGNKNERRTSGIPNTVSTGKGSDPRALWHELGHAAWINDVPDSIKSRWETMHVAAAEEWDKRTSKAQEMMRESDAISDTDLPKARGLEEAAQRIFAANELVCPPEVRIYRDDPGHSYADMFSTYIGAPRALKRSYPKFYDLMRESFGGVEYIQPSK